MQTLISLAELPTEPDPWGRALTRARRHQHLSLDAAAELVSVIQFTDASTLSKLENRLEEPTDKGMRQRAVLLLLACGVDPASIGMGEADLPEAMSIDWARNAFQARTQAILAAAGTRAAKIRSRCFSRRPALRAVA